MKNVTEGKLNEFYDMKTSCSLVSFLGIVLDLKTPSYLGDSGSRYVLYTSKMASLTYLVKPTNVNA